MQELPHSIKAEKLLRGQSPDILTIFILVGLVLFTAQQESYVAGGSHMQALCDPRQSSVFGVEQEQTQ